MEQRAGVCVCVCLLLVMRSPLVFLVWLNSVFVCVGKMLCFAGSSPSSSPSSSPQSAQPPYEIRWCIMVWPDWMMWIWVALCALRFFHRRRCRFCWEFDSIRWWCYCCCCCWCGFRPQSVYSKNLPSKSAIMAMTMVAPICNGVSCGVWDNCGGLYGFWRAAELAFELPCRRSFWCSS